MKLKKIKLGRYFFEFVSMFFAVIAAFGLNNWNENRRDQRAEEKILIEINNGLELDLIDFQRNQRGHNNGLKACNYFEKVIEGKEVSYDSIMLKYYFLTGDNIVIMNVSGYESLKSKGLEIIQNDSLRSQIVKLYENNYQILKSFEENSPMNQHFDYYFFPINDILSPYFKYNERGRLSGLHTPLNLSAKEKNLIKSYLFNIRASRDNKVYEYEQTEILVKKLRQAIEKELSNR